LFSSRRIETLAGLGPLVYKSLIWVGRAKMAGQSSLAILSQSFSDTVDGFGRSSVGNFGFAWPV
jgi:hypothetical protein